MGTLGPETAEGLDRVGSCLQRMASDPGFYDVLGEDEPVRELPYPQEYDYLWTEERDALNLKWDPFSWFRGAENRQAATGLGTLATVLVVGIAYTGILIANSLLAERPKLENDAMCGITTGGQDECWWDCMVVSDSTLSGQAVANLECLSDCFSDASGTRKRKSGKGRRGGKKGRKGGRKGRQISDAGSSCYASLINDVTSKGTCDDGNNPAKDLNIWGWSELPNSCTLDVLESSDDDYYNYDYSEDSGSTSDYEDSGSGSGSGDEYEYPDYPDPMVITEGTCSADTEAALQTAECQAFHAKLPDIIKNTLELVVQFSCKAEVYNKLPWANPSVRKKGKKKRRNKRTRGRLAPISEVDLAAGTRTELNFENTRHRYPWICSLRTRGADPEHLCAVNLLSVPPNPTVIVGSAHCTYQCRDKNDNGVTLPACCCVDSSKGQESCSEDTDKCGTEPKAVEMDGSAAEILCGEWQTGSTTPQTSGEQYNVLLPITEIVRSPNFDAKDRGPEGGSDIAVFKVNDYQLKDSRKNRIYPACLPPKDRSYSEFGVHSGWTKPPTIEFIEKFAKGYNGSYGDFFKQWHYKMRIQEKCADPTKTQAFGLNITYPSNTYYPPASVCALDVTSQSCFSTGDSGPPLMVREADRPMRYFIEGILSFVKGCEQFVFGARSETRFELLQNSENPAAYAKLSCHLPWIADQYGMSYEAEEDETCTKTDSPSPPYDSTCRQTKGTDLTAKEHPCIFPFYYNGTGPYYQCMLFEEENFVYPVFRCPTRNITTKYKDTGINHFEDVLELTQGYCYDIALAQATCDLTLEDGGPDCQRLLDPSATCPDFLRLPPFSTCKNDCPGVRSFGIIGGGAVLVAATGLAGVGPLVAGGGGIAAAGGAGAYATCNPPFCRARSGQCCLLQPGRRPGRFRCPRSC